MMGCTMRTLGIDLASQPAGTAACMIRWDDAGGQVELPVLGVTDETALSLIAAADVTGVDAPFGWPLPYARAIHRYTTEGVWNAPAIRDLRFRLTEQRVCELTGRNPLSATSDWIAWATWRCVGLLSSVAGGQPVDRVGGMGVVEVYPAAALRLWGITSAGYKKEPDARDGVLSQLLERTAGRLRLADGVRAALVASDHALDAMLSALVAKVAARPDRITWPDAQIGLDERERITVEGWIHLPPPQSLEQL
jgi:predicted nuclease with RNAse H fold